jgi:diphthamide synthase subunit DPH2
MWHIQAIETENTTMNSNRFQAFKKSIDGKNESWGFVTNITHKQATDEKLFPFGKHSESDGREYVWSYSVMGLK